MKKTEIIIALILAGIAAFGIVQKAIESNKIPEEDITPIIMKITSPAFQNNSKIPSKYTCDAEDRSPELVFSEVPENAQSLVLISHDPDAPRPGGWTHWIIINMDPKTPGIGEGERPNSGLELNTDFGRPGYGGPCPPSGSHRYYFYLYALDAPLDLDVRAGKEDVEAAMEGHVIEKAEWMGTYERK